MKTIIVNVSRFFPCNIDSDKNKIKIKLGVDKKGHVNYCLHFKNNAVVKSFIKILVDALEVNK